MNRFVYSEGARAGSGGVCVLAAAAPAPPTPLARAHSSTPRDSRPRAPRPSPATLMGSYVFVQRFLLFAAAVVLFFVQEVHAPALLFHLLLGYHLSLVSPRRIKSPSLMYPIECATLHISIYEILIVLKLRSNSGMNEHVTIK